jgi:hypothetical protein
MKYYWDIVWRVLVFSIFILFSMRAFNRFFLEKLTAFDFFIIATVFMWGYFSVFLDALKSLEEVVYRHRLALPKEVKQEFDPAKICPVCNGLGQAKWEDTDEKEKECWNCCGKGVL